jgi:DNA-binding PadR family transcriptional regulator
MSDEPRGRQGDREGRRGGRRGGGFGGAFTRGYGGGPAFGSGPPRGRGRRHQERGNVRAAVLALLAEQPRNGYAIIGELTERSGGRWRPNAASIYPTLSQLQDEGLLEPGESDGRRVYALTDAGRAYVGAHPMELREPWLVTDRAPRERPADLYEAVLALGSATREVTHTGSDGQMRRAHAVLDEARRSLYRILAEDASEEEPPGPV